MGGYMATAGTMVASVIILIILLNRHAALGTISSGTVASVSSLAALSQGGPGN